MADNTRKYCLDVCELMSCGIQVTGTSTQCSILQGFTVQVTIDSFSQSVAYGDYYGGGGPIGGGNLGNEIICDYPALTTEQLKLLTTPEYEKRVCDYLKYINIEESTTKDRLLEDSTYYDPLCDFICRLNSEFLVYIFLDGVRVVDIGAVNGTAQYKAYPIGDDPETHSWQTSPTFNPLTLIGIYIFEVRDFYGGEEYCKVSKTVSLATLVPSTTFSPPSKLVYIHTVGEHTAGPTCFNVGCMCVSPVLAGGEQVRVSYRLGAEASGSGEATAELFCKPNGTGSFLPYRYLDNTNTSPVIGTFTLSQGDQFCHTIQSVAPTPGSCACSCFELTGVNGLGTTLPTIDVGRCCVHVEKSSGVVTSNIYIERCTTTSSSASGEVKFSPAIPAGNYIDLDIRSFANTLLAGTSTVQIYCQTGGIGLPAIMVNHSYLNPQPNNTTVRASYGDKICYALSAAATGAGDSGTGEFEIINNTSSGGVNGIIQSAGGSYCCGCSDSFNVVSVSTNTCLAICVADEGGVLCCYNHGYINAANAALSGSQCVRIELDLDLNVDRDSPAIVGTDSCIRVWCKRAIDSSYGPPIIECLVINGFNQFFETFYLCAGDTSCYCMEAKIAEYDSGDIFVNAYMGLSSVLGYNGVTAGICSAKREIYLDTSYFA